LQPLLIQREKKVKLSVEFITFCGSEESRVQPQWYFFN